MHVSPGLCPEPIEFFTEWEHAYLVTELVPGRTLVKWTVATTPVIHAGESPEVFADYYRRCRAILDRLGAQLAALHELGYAFIDVGPGNVLIDDDDTVRLVDFEATQRVDHPPGVLGTPGFEPPELRAPGARAGIDPRYVDAYGLAAIAQLLVFPINEVVQRSPETLDHLHADLADLAPVPTELWHAATRFRPETASRRLPTPDSVRESPREALRHLRDRTAEALQSMADPTHPRRVYPTIPDGHASNTRCVAYGTAGVLHALSLAGREVDPAVVARLRDDSLRNRRKTPPGLLFGNAGIAWVLADLGEHDAAATLLAEATEHRLTRTAAGWGGGAAGVAMTHLSFYCRTGDPSHLDQARRLLDALPHGDALIPLLGADNASGLVHGRPGVALALYYLAALTGAPEPFERGIRLLREELAHAEPMPVDALGFRVSDSDRRNMPYLACGAAGYVHVLARYLSAPPRPRTGADTATLPAHGEHPVHHRLRALLRAVRARARPRRGGRRAARARPGRLRPHPTHRAVQARGAPPQRCPLAGEPRLPAERGPVDGIRRSPGGAGTGAHRNPRSPFHARPVRERPAGVGICAGRRE